MVEWLIYSTLITIAPVPLVLFGSWIISGPSKPFFIFRETYGYNRKSIGGESKD